MDLLKNIQLITGILIGFGVILTGGVGSFFIIRAQLVKTLKDELDISRDKITRLQTDFDIMSIKYEKIATENLALISERDYLKNLIVTALTTKNTMHAKILEETKYAIGKKMIVKK